MTKREQTMAAGVLGVVILGGVGFLFNLFFLGPLSARQATIASLQAEKQRKEERINQVQAQQAQLQQWKRESLPGDRDQDQMATTRRLYSEYLRDLLNDSGLASPTLKIDSSKPDTRTSPTVSGKKQPIYTRLKFTVEEARGNLAALVTMMERFYRTPLLHEIKEISVQRPRTRTGGQRADDLDIKLTVEALVVNGAEVRSYLSYLDRRLVVLDAVAGLTGGPFGLGVGLWEAGPGGKLAPTPLARSERSYADIAARNIFYPAAEEEKKSDVDVARFVYLTDITRDDHRCQAFLYDRYNNRSTRLRASRGFDSFKVVDENGKTVVRGKVLRMDERDVYFQADEKFYVIHVGQSLDEALRNPLPKSKVEQLKLVAER